MYIKILNILDSHLRIQKICIIYFWVIWCVRYLLRSGFRWWVVAWSWHIIVFFRLVSVRCNLLSSGEINLTDLNSFERFFVVHISSLLCSLWQIKLVKGATGCERETSCLSLGGNNNMLPLCISLSYTSSVNISWIVKSTTELWLNSSNVLLLLWAECIDDFRSRSDVAGVVKLLVIFGMKELYFDCIAYYPWEN